MTAVRSVRFRSKPCVLVVVYSEHIDADAVLDWRVLSDLKSTANAGVLMVSTVFSVRKCRR